MNAAGPFLVAAGIASRLDPAAAASSGFGPCVEIPTLASALAATRAYIEVRACELRSPQTYYPE